MEKSVKKCQNQLESTFFRQKRRNLVPDNTTHQHQIRRIPDIVVHQIIAEMPEGRHQKGTLLEFIHFLGFTLGGLRRKPTQKGILGPTLAERLT